MNSTYTLKNFRIFDEQGATFEMAPITILTGCNNSGKSTITKSLMLLSDMFIRIIKDYVAGNRCYLEDYTLRLNKGIHNLGKFASIVNNQSKTEEFIIEFSQYTHFYCGKLTAKITFVTDESNILRNGRIKDVAIFNNKDEHFCLLNFNTGEAIFNFSVLKNNFFEFAHYASIYKEYSQIYSKLEEAHVKQQKVSENVIHKLEKLEEELGEKYLYVFKHGIPTIYKRDNLDKLVEECDFETVSQYKSLFYIGALKWLDGYKKVDVRRIVNNHIKHSILQYCLYKEDVDVAIKKINLIIDEFYNSSFKTFHEFYLYYEDLFLRNIKSEFMSEKKDEQGSFLSKIEHSLAYHYAGLNSVMNFVKDVYVTNIDDEQFFWQQEEYRFIFIVHYMRLLESYKDYEQLIKKDVVNRWFDTPIFDAFILYVCNILEDILVDVPSYLNNISFVDANRANVRRLYAFDEHDASFNTLLQRYLNQNKIELNRSLFEVYNIKIKSEQVVTVKQVLQDGTPVFNKPVEMGIEKFPLSMDIDDSLRYNVGAFAKKWIKEFDIADDIDFNISAEDTGISVFLIKDGVKRNLADFGFGVTQLVSMLLQIDINISENQVECGREYIEPKMEQKNELDEKSKKKTVVKNICRVNYTFKNSYIVLEEPESHLHPYYQSKLTDMLLDAYEHYNIHFIIETHSEYLVRRSQVVVAERKYKDDNELAINCPFKVYYIPKPKEGKPYELKYSNRGNFTRPFGSGFFDEADNLATRLML